MDKIYILSGTRDELNKQMDEVTRTLKLNRCKILSVQYGGSERAPDGYVKHSVLLHFKNEGFLSEIPAVDMVSKEIE